jgi:hypothetical protein
MKHEKPRKRDEKREIAFTPRAATIALGMKSHELDFDYLFLLEALESGVVPADEHVETLIGMGLVERTQDGGLALTLEARLKLVNLRSLLREHPMPFG